MCPRAGGSFRGSARRRRACSSRDHDSFRAAMESAAPTAQGNPLTRTLQRIEGGLLVAAFLLSMVLPLVAAIGRRSGGFSIPGSDAFRPQLTLALAMLGGLLATRARGHLTLSTAEALGKAHIQNAARLFSSSVAAAVCMVLA